MYFRSVRKFPLCCLSVIWPNMKVLLLACFLICTRCSLNDDYNQLFSHRFLFSSNAADGPWRPLLSVSSVSSISERHLVTPSGIFQFQLQQGALQIKQTEWTNLPSTPQETNGCVAKDAANSLWLLCASRYFFCTSGTPVCTTSALVTPANPVNDAAVLSGSECLVATLNGLLRVSSGASSLKHERNPQISQSVTCVAVSASGVIAAGTPTYLYRSGVVPGKLHLFKTPGIIDAAPSGLAFDLEGNLWVANEVCVNVQRADLSFERVGGLQGLPMDNLTSVSVNSVGDVWLGSTYGVVHHRRATGEFAYYNGPRYIPGKSVAQSALITAVQALPWGALVANSVGLAALEERTFSLQQKAALIDAIMVRHELTSPREGQRIPGWLANTCKLGIYGNVSSWFPESDDNSGLWTAIYLTGQIFKYQVTKDPADKAHAWKYFQGMQFLNHVTGIKGLMARSVLYQDTFPPFGHWVHSNTTPGWIWKRDTSSDEVDGHLLAYTMVYHLLAETPSEKSAALELINNILHYIIDNGYLLIDVTGKPTTWGRWSPYYLNEDQDWYDERGLNSLQILSWIVSAYGITKDPYYVRAYDYLTKENAYDVNVINTKITQPSDDNYSDDELTYVPYLTYWVAHDRASSELSHRLHPFISRSVNRTWAIVSDYRPTPYAAITHLLMGRLPNTAQYGEAVLTVRQWNLEQIDWPMDNSRRLDTLRNPEAARKGSAQFLPPVLPYNEIGAQRWNGNPFNVGTGGAGMSEVDAGAFSFAYWSARFTGAF